MTETQSRWWWYLPVINMRGGQESWRQARKEYVKWNAMAWVNSFAWDFPFTGVLERACFTTVKTSVLYVLACGDVVHDRYKFIHHRGPSGCERVDSRDGTKKPNEWRNESEISHAF
jgi:hypothetical protein